MGRSFPIRVVVERTGLSARQIRYYERRGLIQVDRSGGGQRMYGPGEIDRLCRIKELLTQGASLEGVAPMLEGDSDALPEGGQVGAGRPLTSLYPVSDRAALERILDGRRGRGR